MLEIAPGSQDQSVYFQMRDDATAQGKTGLTSLSAGAVASYTRRGSTATQITLSDLAAANSAHSDGGLKEVSDTLARGVYRLDLPDAAVAAGVSSVIVNLAFDGTLDEGLLILLRSPTNNTGAGAVTYTVTVLNSVTSQPISGAEVWVSTDEDGDNVVAGALSTDASGEVTFYLDAGAYYVWVADEGYTGTNPTAVTVA